LCKSLRFGVINTEGPPRRALGPLLYLLMFFLKNLGDYYAFRLEYRLGLLFCL
jgi:hypothetical protein